jgi:hypothetical protein
MRSAERLLTDTFKCRGARTAELMGSGGLTNVSERIISSVLIGRPFWTFCAKTGEAARATTVRAPQMEWAVRERVRVMGASVGSRMHVRVPSVLRLSEAVCWQNLVEGRHAVEHGLPLKGRSPREAVNRYSD